MPMRKMAFVSFYPDSPIKYIERSMYLKDEWRKGMAKRAGKADTAQDNASVKMPNRRFTQKTKRHGLCLHSYILKKEKEREER